MNRQTFGIVLVLLGLGTALVMGGSTLSFVRKAKSVRGTIVSFSPRIGKSKTVLGDVKYDWQGNEKHAALRFKQYRDSIGQSVPLLINPAHPDRPEIDSFLNLWIWPLIGLVFASVGIIQLVSPSSVN